MKLLWLALLLLLPGCVTSDDDSVYVVMMANNGTDQNVTLWMGGYGSDRSDWQEFPRVQASTIGPGFADTTAGAVSIRTLESYTWEVSMADQTYTFHPEGCRDLWLVTAHLIEDDGRFLLGGTARCISGTPESY